MKIELSEIGFARLIDRLFNNGWGYYTEKNELLWKYSLEFLRAKKTKNEYREIIENDIGWIVLYYKQYAFKAILGEDCFVLNDEN